MTLRTEIEMFKEVTSVCPLQNGSVLLSGRGQSFSTMQEKNSIEFSCKQRWGGGVAGCACVSISGLAGHTVSAAAAQLCPCSVQAATEDTQQSGRGHVPIKLYLQQAAGRTKSWVAVC